MAEAVYVRICEPVEGVVVKPYISIVYPDWSSKYIELTHSRSDETELSQNGKIIANEITSLSTAGGDSISITTSMVFQTESVSGKARKKLF